MAGRNVSAMWPAPWINAAGMKNTMPTVNITYVTSKAVNFAAALWLRV